MFHPESINWPQATAPIRAIFPTDYSFVIFVASTAFFCSFFYVSVHVFNVGKVEAASEEDISKGLRAKSWLVTLVASLAMTLASLPFVMDLVIGGGDVVVIKQREALSDAASALFVAYLVTDLVLGTLHYRSQMNVLTGWVHHTVYIGLVLYILSHRYSHIFVLAAFMELPTFILALSMLIPATRSDEFFAVMFFAVRIVYHGILLVIFAAPYGRLHGTALFNSMGEPLASSLPVISLLAAAPLHIHWFVTSTQGMIRRRNSRRVTTDAPRLPPSPFLLPARPRLASFTSFSLPRPGFLASRRALGRPSIERTVRDYFRLPTELRLPSPPNTSDLMHAVRNPTPTLTNLRMRAGRSGEEMRRFGGRLRRSVQGTVA